MKASKKILTLFLTLLYVAPMTWANDLLKTDLNSANMMELIQTQMSLQQTAHFKRISFSEPELESTFKKLSIEKPLEISAHVSQTILFLITMASMDLTYQKLKLNGGSVKSSDMTNLLDESTQAALRIINSGNVWSGMFGAWVSTSFLAPFIVEPNIKKTFIEVFQKSILTTAAFMGWDAGAQLWKEATYLLEDQSEYNRVTSLWGVGSGALSALLFSLHENLYDQKDLLLAKKMFANIFKVAFFNQQLRSEWLNNTWRTRIATGVFATYLTAIITTGAIGSRINPGGGTIAGFMLGIAGATVALITPTAIKDNITEVTQKIRSGFILGGLNINYEVVHDQLLKSKKNDWITVKQHYRSFEEMLKQRHSYRSDYITTAFEAVRMELKRLLMPNQKIPKQDSLYALHSALADLQNFTSTEQKLIEKLYLDSEVSSDDNIKLQLANEMLRFSFISQFLKEVGTVLVGELTKEIPPYVVSNFSTQTKAIVNYIEINYDRGFDEDKLLELSSQH